jgi:cobalamin synthase
MTIVQAFNFLTLSGDEREFYAGPAGVGVLALPLAGMVIGVALMFLNRAAESYLASEILGALLLTVLIIATAGRHLSGLEKTFARPQASLPRPAGDWPLAGVLAVILVMMFKAHSIALSGESRSFTLLLTPLLARWSLLLFLFGSTASADDGAAQLAQRVRPWHLILASVATVGFTFLIAGHHGLWIALLLSILALAARSYFHYHEGGISLAGGGALIEIGEALSFTLFASI